MTDQLRETMTRIADRIEPAAPDPTLWARARRARRRGEILTASAIGAAVFAVAATVGVSNLCIRTTHGDDLPKGTFRHRR